MQEIEVRRCTYCTRPETEKFQFPRQSKVDKLKIPEICHPICGSCFSLARCSKQPPYRYNLIHVDESDFAKTAKQAQVNSWGASQAVSDLLRVADFQVTAMQAESELLLKRLQELHVQHTETTAWIVQFERTAAEALYGAYTLRRKEANLAISKPLLRLMVFQRDGFACVGCKSERDLSVDHIVPVKGGGTDEFENLQTLCGTCNSRKGSQVNYKFLPE